MTRLRTTLVLALLTACTAESPPPPAPAPAAETSTISDVSELSAAGVAADIESWPGAAGYRERCAACHEGQVPKAPHKTFLQMLTAPTIIASLENGLMKTQGAVLTSSGRREIAEYLAGTRLDAVPAAAGAPRCEGAAASFDLTQGPLRTGWGYDNARFVPAPDAQIAGDRAARLELAWAFEFPHATRARSQPHIAYGAVYVGSQDGTVYALDLATGCVRWTFKASGEVRTAVVPYEAAGRSPRVYFGDVLARAYSVDALTGRLAWSAKLDDHPNATLTGTATLHEGVLYQPISSLEVTTAADPEYECCTFRGAIAALDAWSGELRWKSHTIDAAPAPVRKTRLGTRIFAPSGAPVWNSPTIDAKRGVLYVGTGENYSSPADDRSDALLALRLADGRVAWSRQMLAGDAWNVGCMMKDNPNCPDENGPDLDFASGAILVQLSTGKDVLVAGQKNGVVYALDPDRGGEVLWQRRVGRGGIQGGVHFGMAAEGTRVYAPIADMRDGRDGRPTVGEPRPGLYALDAASGELRWSSPAVDRCGTTKFCDSGISAAITAIPGIVFAGHMDGTFRAYDGETGRTVFEYDSKQPVKTVSGAMARGGSFGGPGAAVRGGYVVVNSGYGLYFHMPGNVLLTFRPSSRRT
jgi:polyvinyl alcohol dehydrogenase (cytochrome)